MMLHCISSMREATNLLELYCRYLPANLETVEPMALLYTRHSVPCKEIAALYVDIVFRL